MTGRRKTVARQKSGGRKAQAPMQKVTSRHAQKRKLAKQPIPLVKRRVELEARAADLMRRAGDDSDPVRQRYYRDEFEDTEVSLTIKFRDLIKKALKDQGLPLDKKYVDCAAAHGDTWVDIIGVDVVKKRVGVTGPRNLNWLSEDAWSATEWEKYGPSMMWPKYKRMNQMKPEGYQTLAEAFPKGKFYPTYDGVYIISKRKPPMTIDSVGRAAAADTAEYLGDDVYYFWWD